MTDARVLSCLQSRYESRIAKGIDPPNFIISIFIISSSLSRVDSAFTAFEVTCSLTFHRPVVVVPSWTTVVTTAISSAVVEPVARSVVRSSFVSSRRFWRFGIACVFCHDKLSFRSMLRLQNRLGAREATTVSRVYVVI